MSTPKPIELFAFYHLGLDADGSYKFRNLNDCARRWNVDNATVQRWLQDAHIDPATVKSVPFNLTRYHVDAQFVRKEQQEQLIRDAWQGYMAELKRTLRHGRGGAPDFHFDIDYDDVWEDGARRAQADDDQ